MARNRAKIASASRLGIRRAHVIGGGLAGMTVARALARGGFSVSLLESSDHLGGKAGSIQNGKDQEDHGYHIFPAWYANTLALLEELKLRSTLIPIRRTHTLRRGEFPRFVTSLEWSSPWNVLQNLFGSAVLDLDEHLLAIYAALDLAAEPVSQRAYLDRVSAAGFMRSRFYSTERVADYHHQTVLQSIAVPLHEVSAMTLRRTLRSWWQQPSPIFWILPGSLQARFIDPYAGELERCGVKMQTSRRVVSLRERDGRIAAYELDDGSVVGTPDDVFVLAVPHQNALAIVSASALSAEIDRAVARGDGADTDFGLGKLAQLRSAPIAAYHLHFKRTSPEIPPEHVGLYGSRFGISFIDVAPHWPLEHTTLNLIASNFTPISHLGDEQIKQLLFAELCEYIPGITRGDVRDDLGHLQTHREQPFFLNTVAAWASRPEATTGIENLYLAGDYCRTGADLTSMEGAVMSGLSAAQAVFARAGIAADVTLLPIAEPSSLALQALKYGALPFVLPLGLLRQSHERLMAWWGEFD